MNFSRNIYLVGMPGAGKSTVGRQLARRIHRRFLDTDQEIEARTGAKIPLIFELEGESGFRDRESGVLEEISAQENQVIATGGGMVLREKNREVLRKTGLVIYIYVSPRLLFERTRHASHRPLLQVEDPLKKIDELYAQRDPLYRSVADIVVTGGTGGVGVLVKHIEKEIESRCAV